MSKKAPIRERQFCIKSSESRKNSDYTEEKDNPSSFPGIEHKTRHTTKYLDECNNDGSITTLSYIIWQRMSRILEVVTDPFFKVDFLNTH